MLHYGATPDSNLNVTADVDGTVSADPNLRLVGYSIRENKAVAAVCAGIIVHGATAAAGTPLVYMELAADKSETQWFGDDGIACPNGLSIDFETGEFDITLYYKKGEL